MKSVTTLAFLWLPWLAFAQIDDANDFFDQSNFEAFQKQSEQRFSNFQDSVNSRFTRELARQWKAYEEFQATARPSKPKPVEPTVAPKDTTPKQNKELPVGAVIKQETLPQPLQPAASEAASSPQPLNIQRENAADEEQTQETQSYHISIDFYQEPLDLTLPTEYAEMSMPDISERSVANLWEQLSQCDVSGYVSQCQYYIQQYFYNDWAVYEMICDFARSAFPQQYATQTVFTVFLLNQLNMDAQVGRKNRQLVVLLPSVTTIYDVNFIKRDEIHYYVFSLYPELEIDKTGIYTYSVKYSNCARAVNLQLDKPIRLRYNPAKVTYTTDYWSDENEMPIPLKINQNMLDFYAHYPQVDMKVYATAQMTQELMDWAERQIAPILAKVNAELAVSLLMDYIQHDFDYATDNQQFGYEKPFFCEENFYYPKNDCEDRAILLSYFVRNFVNADIVLLDYPDHIATAVAFPEESEVTGDYYLLNGRKYYVCDPTYTGAGIGETMPQYQTVKADIMILK